MKARPLLPRAVLGGLTTVGTPDPAAGAAGGCPTPKANDPAVVWPSAADVVRHVTVYVPLASVGRATRTPFGSAGSIFAGDDSTLCPEPSSTCTASRPAS